MFEKYRHDAFERHDCIGIPGVHKCPVQQSLNRCFCGQRVLEVRMHTRTFLRQGACVGADTRDHTRVPICRDAFDHAARFLGHDIARKHIAIRARARVANRAADFDRKGDGIPRLKALLGRRRKDGDGREAAQACKSATSARGGCARATSPHGGLGFVPGHAWGWRLLAGLAARGPRCKLAKPQSRAPHPASSIQQLGPQLLRTPPPPLSSRAGSWAENREVHVGP